MVTEKLVSSEQIILGQVYQVINASNVRTDHSLAVVNLRWGGVTGPKRVVVSPDLPVDCLLGNHIETSAWSEVEFRTHAEMMGISASVFAVIRAQA